MTAGSQSNPAADAKYEAIAKEYDARYVGPRWELYDQVTLTVAATHLPPPPARILDAGAGTGKFALTFLERGYHVTLLDPSQEMLDTARRKIQQRLPNAEADYVPGSIERMDFPDGAFDFVFCEGDPLSYCLTTYPQAARELLRVLRPGGGFYISCDSRWFAVLAFLGQNDAARAFACAQEGTSNDPYGVPVHAFGPTELAELLGHAGARDVHVTGKLVFAHFFPSPHLDKLLANPDTRRRLFELETALAREPGLAGLASHLHAVGLRG